MTNFARSLARLARLGSWTPRRALLAGIVAGCALFAASAAPAGAVVTTVGETTVGLQPRTINAHIPSGSFSNNTGNVVVNGASVYLVFWDPGAWLHPEWVLRTEEFLQHLGDASGEPGTIFAALPQYRDRANEQAADHFVYKGAYSDTAAYPAAKCTDPEPLLVELEPGQGACLTDAQVRAQLQSFIASHGTEKGMHAIYYVVTPPGVAVCLDEASEHCSDYTEGKASESHENSFCSYHGDINPDNAAQGDASTILYAAIPWSAGYEGNPWDYAPGASAGEQAYDCQDGGWDPTGGGEKYEKKEPLTKEQKEALEKMSPQERAEAEKSHELSGPHIEEPNQGPPQEEGDFAAGLPDLLIGQIAEEQANIVTDPLLSSWQDPATGYEATDECRNIFASTSSPSVVGGSSNVDPHTEAGTLSNESVSGANYYINNVVNMGGLHGPGGCVGGEGLVARFTAPDPVNVGELVDFDGMGSTVSELKGYVFGPSGPPKTTYATFTWNFGDGSPEVTGYAPGAPACEAPWLSPCAASAIHTYAYGGEYNATLTVTDVQGQKSRVLRVVNVIGPPPPAPPSPGAAGSSSSGAGAGKGGPSSTPAPVVSAAVISHSLRHAVKRGLVVRYSVNEQVAGHFEVMISRTLAKHLKLGGAPARGLPAGTAPQVVIAKAILVTTKGGRSTIDIHFSKTVAARLAHAHTAPLMLRLSVRNSVPLTATLLSSFTLAH